MKKEYIPPVFEEFRFVLSDNLLTTSGEDFVPDINDEFDTDGDDDW